MKGLHSRSGPDSTEPLATVVMQLLEAMGSITPRVGVVLGSGLAALSEAVADRIEIPYTTLDGFARPTVAGHAGKFVAGTIGTVPVLLQSGRFHLYEGFAPETVVLPIRAMAALGIGTVIVTNAAGGLSASMPVPGLMSIVDHINLMWRNPLIGGVHEGETRFPDMSAPYDPGLLGIVRDVAREGGIAVGEGVYVGVLGPNYETPAEIRMLRGLGADAVGMSTVPEVIAARARGMRVAAISTISNYAAGIASHPLSHAEVLEAGQMVTDDLQRLICSCIARVALR